MVGIAVRRRRWAPLLHQRSLRSQHLLLALCLLVVPERRFAWRPRQHDHHRKLSKQKLSSAGQQRRASHRSAVPMWLRGSVWKSKRADTGIVAGPYGGLLPQPHGRLRVPCGAIGAAVVNIFLKLLSMYLRAHDDWRLSQRLRLGPHSPCFILQHPPGASSAHAGFCSLSRVSRSSCPPILSVIEAPWLVNGGHGASFRHHTELSGVGQFQRARSSARYLHSQREPSV
jgi:hypothetical protein